MTSVKCSLGSCTYRGKRGACTCKRIVLQDDRNECNELYCLSWRTPETRMFEEIAGTKIPEALSE